MIGQRPHYTTFLGILALAAATVATAQQPTTTTACTGPRFEIVFDPSVCQEPFTGRVYVCLTKRRHLLPADQVDWFDAEPFFARDVENWRSGEKLIFTSDNCLGYPGKLNELPARTYRAQAVLSLNDWAQHPIRAPGNGHSDIAVFKYTGERPVTIRLNIKQTYPPQKLIDSDDLKHVKLKSKLLSQFYNREVFLQATVGLPQIYSAEPQRLFPTVYTIPGFGGSAHRHGMPRALGSMLAIQGLDAAVVFLDASCPTGHHVFADSANNGPWGTALVTELIPYLEQQFRLIPDPEARYLTGHSSGGWSSLWLLITYPDTFGGVWSTSPDPVDFAEFMRVNIYNGTDNMLVESDGSPRLLSRPGIFGKIAARDICDLENVLGRGGQMGSFEAVFSPRGSDGQSARLWNRITGKLDPKVAKAWRKYDIRQLIEANWETLGPKLEGKLYLYCGELDSFFLERAFIKLRETLSQLGSDAYIELVPGADHMLPPTVFMQIATQMAEQFEQRYKKRHNE